MYRLNHLNLTNHLRAFFTANAPYPIQLHRLNPPLDLLLSSTPLAAVWWILRFPWQRLPQSVILCTSGRVVRLCNEIRVTVNDRHNPCKWKISQKRIRKHIGSCALQCLFVGTSHDSLLRSLECNTIHETTDTKDKAIDIGFSQTSTLFIQAVSVFCHTSEGMWEVKLQTLRDLGLTDDNIFAMFRKQPMVFSVSEKKMKNVIELLLGTGKYNISSIVTYPTVLGCSVEKRLEPRLQIMGVLESRNLIEKWPALSILSRCKDDNFFERFIRPHYDEIGEETQFEGMSPLRCISLNNIHTLP